MNEEKDEAGMLVYVSTDGNDFNTGTEEAPLATSSGARNKIRKIKTA